MSDSKTSASGGIGFFGLLGIVFITLKLCGVIDWSWWWVTAPLWGPLAALVSFLVGVLIMAVGSYALIWLLERK
jgi:hypothetical protein